MTIKWEQGVLSFFISNLLLFLSSALPLQAAHLHLLLLHHHPTKAQPNHRRATSYASSTITPPPALCLFKAKVYSITFDHFFFKVAIQGIRERICRLIKSREEYTLILWLIVLQCFYNPHSHLMCNVHYTLFLWLHLLSKKKNGRRWSAVSAVTWFLTRL